MLLIFTILSLVVVIRVISIAIFYFCFWHMGARGDISIFLLGGGRVVTISLLGIVVVLIITLVISTIIWLRIHIDKWLRINRRNRFLLYSFSIEPLFFLHPRGSSVNSSYSKRLLLMYFENTCDGAKR